MKAWWLSLVFYKLSLVLTSLANVVKLWLVSCPFDSQKYLKAITLNADLPLKFILVDVSNFNKHENKINMKD